MKSSPSDQKNVQSANESADSMDCAHCGTLCGKHPIWLEEKPFCCAGCEKVYTLLHDEGLSDYYAMRDGSLAGTPDFQGNDAYTILEEEQIAERMLDHRAGDRCKVTFRVKGIHCSGCVWLLENLYSLCEGVGRSEVDFMRKEVRIDFDASVIALADVARQLDQLGYAPEISMSQMEEKESVAPDRLTLKVGIAGFAFGNTMLLHLPAYFGMQTDADALAPLFGRLSLILSLPVLFYSSSEFWKNSIHGLQQKRLSIDVPIVIGMVALFTQSIIELGMRTGPGYLDSLCGFVFFLLLGKAYQRRTTDALSFDRDYRSYFPLMARRLHHEREQVVPVTSLEPRDRIRVRNGEIIPADSILLNGNALIDYSFVTGESVPEPYQSGAMLYAGGRQKGSAVEVEIIKPVSQSYLTSLWNDAAFSPSSSRLTSFTDQVSRYFTPTVLVLAFATLFYWWPVSSSVALTSFVAVLIVACPCALALSAPFAFGQAMRILGKHHMYVRSSDVVERLSRINHLLFDKTGTLTAGGHQTPSYFGKTLNEADLQAVIAVADQSTHPLSRKIATLAATNKTLPDVQDFEDFSGKGISARVNGHRIHLGSQSWLHSLKFSLIHEAPEDTSAVYVAIDGICHGGYAITPDLRPGIASILPKLAKKYTIGLITGDHAVGMQAVRHLFSKDAHIRSGQSPQDKLDAVKVLQDQANIVAMVGDGLNDAGALQQSDAGIAVTEDVQAFVPACDAILDANALPNLPNFLRFARATRNMVFISFALSISYNLLGFSLAVTNHLTPVAAAILMPLSSITIVCVATLGTRLAAVRSGVEAQ